MKKRKGRLGGKWINQSGGTMTIAKAAEELGMKYHTLYTWVKNGKVPPPSGDRYVEQLRAHPYVKSRLEGDTAVTEDCPPPPPRQ